MDYVRIIEPDGPVIAIHKGWCDSQIRQKVKPESAPFRNNQKIRVEIREFKRQAQRKEPTQRQYEFVHTTKQERTKDAAMRKLVRTHVRNDYLHNKRQKAASPSPPSLRSALDSDNLSGQGESIEDRTSTSEISSTMSEVDINSHHSLRSFGCPTALCSPDYAIEMQPRMHALLSRYLTYAGQRTYPAKLARQSHSLRSPSWFRLAVTDPAMLHGMLYSAAVCLALLEGRTESQDSIYHLCQTISVVNKRLGNSAQNIEDSTIGALSCLALGEAVTGNKEAWNIHMRGLRKIVQIKTGIPLNPILTRKLHRTDVTGAIDYSEIPHLDFVRSDSPPIWSKLPEHNIQHAAQDVIRILSPCQLRPRLVYIMVDVAHFSQAVQSWRSDPSMIFDPQALSEDKYWIEYRLLLFPTTLGGFQDIGIGEACRLGALLYMKALLEEFPHSVTGPSVLLNKLQESLRNIKIVEPLSPLLFWLSVIGAALSKSEMRSWFISLLEQLTIDFRILSFRDHDLEMSRVIGLEAVFGTTVENIWLEVTAAVQTRETLLQP